MLGVGRRRAYVGSFSGAQSLFGRQTRALDSSSAFSRQRWVASCCTTDAAPSNSDYVVDVTAVVTAATDGGRERRSATGGYANITAAFTSSSSNQPRWRQKFQQDARHSRDFHLLQQPPPRLPDSNGVRHLSSRGGKGKGGRARASPQPNSSSNSSSSISSAGETAEPVITLNGVSKQLPGGRELFGDASLSFVRGAKVGVLGVNGSGKSTVLKILAGEG